MNSFISLLKVQLLSLFSINKYLHSKNEKLKSSFNYFFILISFISVLLLLFSFFYNMIFAYYFGRENAIDLYLAFVGIVASVISFFLTLNKVNGMVYNSKDNDLLLSSPIKYSNIIISRMLTIYIMNLLIVCLIMIPGGIIYGVYSAATIWFYLLFILLVTIIPLVPIGLALIIGTIITWISSHFRYKNIVTILITTALIVAIVYGIFTMYNEKITNISLLSIRIVNVFFNIYPLITFYYEGLRIFDSISIFLFVASSIGIFIAITFLIGVKYKNIIGVVNKQNVSLDYKIGDLRQSSIDFALFKKEFRRFFSSPFYVVNTLIPMVFLVFSSILFNIYDVDALNFIINIELLIPVIISFFVVLCCSTVSSISLEGKSLWVLKSLPIKPTNILFIKVIVNLSITVPVIILSCILLMKSNSYGIVYNLLIFTTPLLFSVYTSLIGLIINLKFPTLDWKNEESAIKQGPSSTILLIVGIGSIIFSLFIMIIFIKYSLTILVLLNLIILIVICFSFRYIKKNGERIFMRL